MQVREKKLWSGRLMAVIVLAALTLLSAANLKAVKEPLGKLIRRELGFEEFVEEVQAEYLSDSFVYKNDFLNLNGLFARLTGRRVLNETVRLNNGMLEPAFADLDITLPANRIAGFSDYLAERNIPFLFVQMPYKEALDGQSFPVGVASYANKVADDLLSRLSAEEVEVMDLRPLLSQTPEMLEQYFYKTDYHWNSDGAFIAFQELMSRLHESFPEGNIDPGYARADQWERHSIDDWFLGSSGRRVGIYFGGTDPLIWHTPKFETELSCAVPVHGLFCRGDFTEANLRSKFIEERHFFTSSPYYIYIGEDYPLVQHRNLYAPSPLKVLMIKDSFTIPLQSFLSTVFQEIDVIDPRLFSECSLAEYAAWTKPDLVILAINPGALKEEPYQNYGVDEAVSARLEESAYELVFRQDIAVEVSDDSYSYTAYPVDPDTVYRISFAGVDILEGAAGGAGLWLYDKATETALANTIFDLAYCEAADGFHWTFRTPDTQDGLQLLFFAGIYGDTAGNSVVYRDAALEKMCS